MHSNISMNVFTYIGYVALIIGIIVSIIKIIEFIEDRRRKIRIQLNYYNDFGLFGSTKEPHFIITITNVSKKNVKILRPQLKHQVTIIFYETVNEAVKYPYNLEPGDQLVVDIDFRYIGQNLEMHNDVLKNTGGRRIGKFEVISEIEDTLGLKYKSNKSIIKV